MRITPLDIYQQEFKRVLRGVDPDGVEDFLERVADDYEQLIKENAALKEQIKSLKAGMTAGKEEDQSDAARKVVREDAGDVIREAKKEADNIIREARKEANSIISKSRAQNVSLIAEKNPEEALQGEMEIILAEAGKKAKEIIEKAKKEELELRGEISRLQSQKERFLIEYRDLLEKHLKFLTEEV